LPNETFESIKTDSPLRRVFACPGDGLILLRFTVGGKSSDRITIDLYIIGLKAEGYCGIKVK